MATYNNIKDAHKEVMAKLLKITKEVFIQVSNDIISESPVDTSHFKGNWQVGINNQITSEVPISESIGRIENVADKLNSMKLRDVIFLSNNLVYGPPLEYGWSSQRPSGWVRTNVAKAQAILDIKVQELVGE